MIEIRETREQDAASVHRVHTAAFGRDAEADLVDALAADGVLTLSLALAVDGEIVAHVAFSPVTLEPLAAESPSTEPGDAEPAAAGPGDADTSVLGLGPMAVLPDHQRTGLGTRLLEQAMARCRADGHDAVVVLGHPEYYPRFGFRPASRLGMSCIWDVPDDVFMAQELRPGALPQGTQRVHYHDVFERV